VKAHISATIDEQLVEDLNRYGLEERRSRSQVIEMALKKFLRRRLDLKDEIVTSEGQFQGRFIREETYDR
jgi:metal-responsive CopG/Arc/MetJ family transcriptional regulator